MVGSEAFTSGAGAATFIEHTFNSLQGWTIDKALAGIAEIGYNVADRVLLLSHTGGSYSSLVQAFNFTGSLELDVNGVVLTTGTAKVAIYDSTLTTLRWSQALSAGDNNIAVPMTGIVNGDKLVINGDISGAIDLFVRYIKLAKI